MAFLKDVFVSDVLLNIIMYPYHWTLKTKKYDKGNGMSKKRRTYKPGEKANIVLELVRGESTVNEIAQKYGVSPQLISRWRIEFLENMPAVFDKKVSESEKLKQEYEAEKEELISQIGQLTVELNWLKKKQQQVSDWRKKRN